MDDAKIVISPSSLNITFASLDIPLKASLVVHNRSQERVRIQIKSTEKHVLTLPASFNLLPSATANLIISVTQNTWSHTVYELFVWADATSTRIPLSIYPGIPRDILGVPQNIDVGNVLISTEKSREFQIFNPLGVPLEFKIALSQSKFIRVIPEKGTIEAAKVCTIKCIFSPLLLASIQSDISIKFDLFGSDIVQIRVHGVGFLNTPSNKNKYVSSKRACSKNTNKLNCESLIHDGSKSILKRKDSTLTGYSTDNALLDEVDLKLVFDTYCSERILNQRNSRLHLSLTPSETAKISDVHNIGGTSKPLSLLSHDFKKQDFNNSTRIMVDAHPLCKALVSPTKIISCLSRDLFCAAIYKVLARIRASKRIRKLLLFSGMNALEKVSHENSTRSMKFQFNHDHRQILNDVKKTNVVLQSPADYATLTSSHLPSSQVNHHLQIKVKQEPAYFASSLGIGNFDYDKEPGKSVAEHAYKSLGIIRIQGPPSAQDIMTLGSEQICPIETKHNSSWDKVMM